MFVRGPKYPITAMTISIAALIRMNTPIEPKSRSVKAMKNPENIADRRDIE